MRISDQHVQQLIQIERHIHYAETPSPGVEPFIVIHRDSPVLLSAPHGARSFRNRRNEWHEEDEYTAGIALLISEMCGTSVMATIWRSDFTDPNDTAPEDCDYKNAMCNLVKNMRISYVIDLHGAADDNRTMPPNALVDIGIGHAANPSLAAEPLDMLRSCLDRRFGQGAVSNNCFAGAKDGSVRTLCWDYLDYVNAVQIEMKASVRIPCRRTDASGFAKDGPYHAPRRNVIKMMQSLMDFISYLRVEAVIDKLDSVGRRATLGAVAEYLGRDMIPRNVMKGRSACFKNSWVVLKSTGYPPVPPYAHSGNDIDPRLAASPPPFTTARHLADWLAVS